MIDSGSRGFAILPENLDESSKGDPVERPEDAVAAPPLDARWDADPELFDLDADQARRNEVPDLVDEDEDCQDGDDIETVDESFRHRVFPLQSLWAAQRHAVMCHFRMSAESTTMARREVIPAEYAPGELTAEWSVHKSSRYVC